MQEYPRHVLDNCTNNEILGTPTRSRNGKQVSCWLPTPPATGSRSDRAAKRRAGGENSRAAKKRVKFSKNDPFLDDTDSESSSSAYESDSGGEQDSLKPLGRVGLWFPCVANVCVQSPGSFKPYLTRQGSLSTRSILKSFVSSHKSDVFRCQSTNERTYLTPPYACSYTHAAKTGQLPLLAVSTEQGTVHILSTMKRKDWDAEPARTTLELHENGIFDVKWNLSDSLIATSSADHSTRITCPETQTSTHILRGHTSTVKCVTWDPAHRDMLATGGRDGSICFWDLRVGNRGRGNVDEPYATCEPVTIIKGAHEAAHINGGRLKPKRGKKDPLPRTVTSLLYAETAPYSLVSSGAFDGILRFWDLRQPTSKRSRTGKIKCLYSTEQDPTTHNGSRGRGITGLAAGHGPTAGIIFGLGADSRVHTYTLPRLHAQETLSFGHEHLQSSSFYTSLSVSPCGGWLASGGGTGMKGSAFVFDIANAARPWLDQKESQGGIELRGQSGEIGAVDWAANMMATCADDGTVRIWRPDLEVHRRCSEAPDENKWEWTWAV